MSAYRIAAPAPPALRFERSLRFVFTHARISPTRVSVDAPDAMAVVGLLAVLGAAGPTLLPLTGGWLTALAGFVVLLLSARVHLRVRPGRVLLVRTLLGLPWWVSRRDARVTDEWSDWDFDGEDLVLPRAPEQHGRGERLVVLTTQLHGVTGPEIDVIARACDEVLRAPKNVVP